MLVINADTLLAEQRCTRFILWLHLVDNSVLFTVDFVFHEVAFFVEFGIKVTISLEFISVFSKKRMLSKTSEGYSLFAIDNKDLFEKVFKISGDVLDFLLLAYWIRHTKKWSAFSCDFRLHVMTLHYSQVTFKWILRKQHEIEQNSQCPNIYRNSIIWATENFWSHIFLSSTMCFSSTSSYRPSKTKICYLVRYLIAFNRFL